jgi:hypothetical protein
MMKAGPGCDSVTCALAEDIYLLKGLYPNRIREATKAV